jgi:hypothetical protein
VCGERERDGWRKGERERGGERWNNRSNRKKGGKINRRKESNKSIAEYVSERLWNYSVKSLLYEIIITFIKHVLSQVREKKTYVV